MTMMNGSAMTWSIVMMTVESPFLSGRVHFSVISVISDLGEVRTRFVVPTQCRYAVMKMGHYAMLGGHMGPQKPLNRICHKFFWTGMNADIA